MKSNNPCESAIQTKAKLDTFLKDSIYKTVEILMAERELLFNLHSTKIGDNLDSSNWSRLQEEFTTRGVSLSQSFLIWPPSGNDMWLLADFENGKTYDIEWQRQKEAKVWTPSSNEEKPTALTYPKTIVSRLKSAQGTDLGFIDLLQKLNLNTLEFNRANFDLLDVHKLLQELITHPRDLLLNLSRSNREECNYPQKLDSRIRDLFD